MGAALSYGVSWKILMTEAIRVKPKKKSEEEESRIYG